MKDRETVTFTTYISPHHLRVLREISEKTGEPICEILKKAIDKYLEKIKRECESLPDLPGGSNKRREK